MDDFVTTKLTEWQLPGLIERFRDEGIDEESFGYLDLHTITTLIPRIGERLKFIKKHNEFDIRAVLSAVPDGWSIVESLDTDQLITGKERKVMVRILVSHLIETCGETPTAVMKTSLASALIHAFPCLNDDSVSGFGTWYAQRRSHHPATGFLEERLHNIRKQLRRSLRGPRPQREQETVPSRIVIPAATISKERAVQFAGWLKNNSQPLAQVEAYMRDSCQYRAGWIRANHSKSIPEVLAMFPRLTTPGMIHYCPPTGARGEVALMLLPVMLPPPIYKQGRKLVRVSVEESKRFFIDVKPVGTNMVEYLEEAKSFRSCPFVLLLNDGMLCSQAFVVISGTAIETETALAAVDTCFKTFYVFDIQYPSQCLPTWQFLQDVVYELQGTVSPAVKFLKTQLHACK